MKGKKVYISGPMTGIENYNRPAFNLAALELHNMGAVVINPHRHPLGLEYEQYMAYAMLDVEHCDCVVCLAGYSKSPGAVREIAKAMELGKEIHYTEVQV